jgi:hypothetical protein
MKRSPKTSSRSTKRDARENLAAPALNALKHPPTPTQGQLRATPDTYTPLSLKTGAGRQYWNEMLRLLVKIRADCDAAAERLGFASSKDDGLAAVEYIAEKILETVHRERQQQIASVRRQSATRTLEGPQQSRTDHELSYKPEKQAQRTGHSERSKLIDELKQMLRDRKTKSGVVIDPQLAHEIAKQITILNEKIAQPETTESIKHIRESIAPFFAKLYGNRKKEPQAPPPIVARKVTRAKRAAPRSKRALTKDPKRRSR